MRHVVIRGLLGLLWLVAALVSGQWENFEMAAFYVLLGGVFLYSAFTTWKKERDKNGGR